MPETQTSIPPGGNPNPTIVEPAPSPQLAPPGGAKPNGAVVVPDWAKDFDDETKALVAKKHWANPSDPYRAYSELEKFAYRDGADKVLIPDATTPDATRDEFFRKLGWPEKAETYQFKAPDAFNDYSPQLAGWWRETAFKRRVPRELAEGLHDEFVSYQVEQAKATQAATEARSAEWDKTLRQEFGTATDARMEIANRALRQFGGDDLVKLLHESGLAGHPAMVRAFVKAGMKLGEQPFVEGDAPGGPGMTPSEAREKVSQIRRDPKHPFNDANASDHLWWTQTKMPELYRAAYPEPNQQ